MLVFIHINKTAGSTVRYILRSTYGTRHCDVEPWSGTWDKAPFSTLDLRQLRRLYSGLASIAGHRVTGYADLGEDETAYQYFTILRDPLKLSASRFQYHVEHRKKTGLVFDEWIQREWLRNAQTKMIAGTPDVSDAVEIIRKKGIFVGLTERFDESMVLLKGLRAEDLEIGYSPVNVAGSNSLAQELLSTPNTREALIDANQADLELYRYVRDELYPALRREYGGSLDEALATYQRGLPKKWNTKNLIACRLKQYLVYKPALGLYRAKRTKGWVERALGSNRGRSSGVRGSAEE